MNAGNVVDILALDAGLVKLLATGADNEPAIYQIIAPEGEPLPRIAILEHSRDFSRWADDQPIEETVRFRIEIYSREDVLNEVTRELHGVLRVNGFVRVESMPDEYLEDVDVFAKGAIFETYIDIPMNGGNENEAEP